jgi:hypothetical protein
MIHKDKQSKWFSNNTSQTEGVWLGNDPITLANYEGLAKSETESILSEAEIEARAIEKTGQLPTS